MAAREATPEVSEEGEIIVDAEEMEELQSKAQQQQAASKPPQGQTHTPTRRQAADRGRERGADRERAAPSRDRQAFQCCMPLFFLCSMLLDSVEFAG